MLVLVLGASKSGKSKIAEDKIASIEGDVKRYYLATMEPYTEEADKAIQRHRQMRKNKGFTTIEKYRNIGEVNMDSSENNVVLLECMGNLVANEMFSDGFLENVSEKIYNDIMKLYSKCDNLVIVSNIVSEDGVKYPYETERYIENICRLNAMLSEKADEVIEAVCGIPYRLK